MAKLWWRRWLGAIAGALFVSACGGRATRHEPPAAEEPDAPRDSDQALRYARSLPELPDDVIAVHARSDPNGQLDPDGRSRTWILVVVSPSAKRAWFVYLGPGDSSPKVDEREVDECLSALPIAPPLRSDLLVPEVEARYSSLDPFPETRQDWTARFFMIEHPCANTLPLTRAAVYRSNPVTGETVSFFYDYSWEGVPGRACELCEGSGYCC